MWVAGVDEVGRGPLAGPVVAAAVILDDAHSICYLDDSKKLNAKRREAAYDTLQRTAIAIGLGQASCIEIDEINILQASMLAMKRAIANLPIKPDEVLVDGNRCPEIDIPVSAIVRGDAEIACISAASIIAKVTRDKIMVKLHSRFPHYGFDRHKGYPTVSHRHALKIFGPTIEHRKSFGPVRRCLDEHEST